jgi:hypothetical protein
VKPEHEALQSYQKILREEKSLLLENEKAKRVIGGAIQRILDQGLLRSVKRETLRMIVEGINGELDGTGRKDGWRDELLSIPLPLETWSQAREAAEDDPKVVNLTQQAAKLRNLILEAYIPLLRATRVAYLGGAPQSMWEDLENEGFIGMIRGLETMDFAKGQGLNEHLQGWALSMMMRYLQRTDYAKALKGVKSLNHKEGKDEVPDREKENLGHLGKRLRGAVGEGEEIELEDSPLLPIDAGFDEAIGDAENFLERLMDQEERANTFRLLVERTKNYSPFTAAVVRLHCAELVPTDEKAGVAMTPEEAFEKMRELAAVNLLQGIELEARAMPQ